jgi:alpha-N-arabinofuranosidase
MQLLADMKPAFLRFPGGNYLEGNTLATRFDWKKTIGDISERPGHMNDAWNYWSSDGMGLLEFLEWCEDLNMEPVLGVYAGLSLRPRIAVVPGEALKPYVQDALDEIEYTIGDTSTTWGARRAKDGHPAPFKLTYVEIGNEENLGSQNQFEARFTQFYDAIKAKYPQLKVIKATPAPRNAPASEILDVYDDHYYPAPAAMIALWNQYDNYDRSRPKVFVGEYATREGNSGPITPSMEYALCDASFIVGMERNSDVVILSAYAPLFVNVNPGATQWRTDLIGFDTLTSFGSPSYYVQKMFSNNHGDTILAVTERGIPTREIPRQGGRRGGADANVTTMQVPLLFHSVTRDSATGTIYVKVVNPMDTPQPLRIQVSGVSKIEPNGELVELKSAALADLNTITEPTRIVPVTTKISGLSTDFNRTFPAFSVSVLKLSGK